MRTFAISAAFIADREARDLPCGTTTRRRSGKLWIDAPDDVAADIIDDAAYQGWHTDGAPAGVVRAARTAFRDCLRHGLTYSKGTRLADNGLAMPGDA